MKAKLESSAEFTFQSQNQELNLPSHFVGAKAGKLKYYIFHFYETKIQRKFNDGFLLTNKNMHDLKIVHKL